MTAGKKVFLLLILLVLLIMYTVLTFEYKTILNDSKTVNYISKLQITKYSDSLLNNINSFKDDLLKKFDLFKKDSSKDLSKVVDLELIKKEDVILMNGTFKDEKQAKSIADLLNINKEGKYKYEEDRVKDVILLKNLSLLITPLKNFFSNDSKLILHNAEIELNGYLKDDNSKALVDSIIAKSNLKVITNINVKKVSRTEEIIEQIKIDSNKNDIKLPEVEELDHSKIEEELETSINEISNKIIFKRRSSVFTDDSFFEVKKIAELLNKNPNIKVEIDGYTYSRGTYLLNKKISKARANSIKNKLIKLGVSPTRLTTVGYGENFPTTKDDVNISSELNRRVEFIIGDKK